VLDASTSVEELDAEGAAAMRSLGARGFWRGGIGQRGDLVRTGWAGYAVGMDFGYVRRKGNGYGYGS
jgi:hypothetical protein